MPLFGKRDDRPALDRGIEAALDVRAQTWEAVEALAVMAVAAADAERPEARDLLSRAREIAAGLKEGSMPSVAALAWLATAERRVL